MKQRFDKEMRDVFSSNLDSIHASDELIQNTLKRLREEGNITEDPSGTGTVLTAIDNRFVAGHIEKKATRSKIIKIVSIAAAAAVLAAGGFLLKVFNTETETETESSSEIPVYQCYSDAPDYYYMAKTAASNKMPEDVAIPVAPQTGASRAYTRAAASRANR